MGSKPRLTSPGSASTVRADASTANTDEQARKRGTGYRTGALRRSAK